MLTACTTQVAGRGSPAGLTCPGPSTTAIVSCLRTSLGGYWSRALGRTISVRVVLSPATDAVPQSCRDAVRVHTAFTCPTDNRIYVTTPYLTLLRSSSPVADAVYRFAATLGHEMGHVVQFAVHAPLVDKDDLTDAQSQQLEQQADCLSGVWAVGVGLDARRFTAAAKEVFELIDSDFERRFHGDPDVRLDAVQRGEAGRTPSSCGLATG